MRNILVLSSVLVFLVIFVFGCSSIPEKSNGSAVLAIPINNQKKDFQNYYADYIFYYDQEEKFSVKASDTIVYIKNIAPGDHAIFSYKIKFRKSGAVYEYKYGHCINFKLIENTITLLPEALEITMIKNSKGETIQHLGFSKYNQMEKDFYIDIIKNSKNSKNWEIN